MAYQPPVYQPVPDMGGIDEWLRNLIEQRYGAHPADAATSAAQAAAEQRAQQQAQRAALMAQLEASLAPLAQAVASGQNVGFQGSFSPAIVAQQRAAIQAIRPTRISRGVRAALAGLSPDGFTRVRPAGSGFSRVRPRQPAFTRVQPRPSASGFRRVRPHFPWQIAG